MEERIKKCIETVSKGAVNTAQIQADSKLVDDFMFDSIMMIELIVELENEFGIEIDEDDLIFEEFNQFDALTEVIAKTVGGNDK